MPLLTLALMSAASADETRDAAIDPDASAAWQAVARGEALVLMRHALAPGTGDPAGFDVEDCTTQRNLSAAGREQAARIGARIAEALGTDAVDVLSSAWCRCLDTGRLLGLGEVRTLPPLNSFFRARDSADAQTEALRRWIDERLNGSSDADAPSVAPAVLVTHQVNLTALTGGFPASGEIFIVDAEDSVLARVAVAPDD